MTEVKTMGRDLVNRDKWRKENIRRFEFYINRSESELLEYLLSVPNRQEYITELIRKDMKHKK